MDGSEVDGCFETIDPAYRSGNDELNSEFIMLTVGSVWKGIYVIRMYWKFVKDWWPFEIYFSQLYW